MSIRCADRVAPCRSNEPTSVQGRKMRRRPVDTTSPVTGGYRPSIATIRSATVPMTSPWRSSTGRPRAWLRYSMHHLATVLRSLVASDSAERAASPGRGHSCRARTAHHGSDRFQVHDAMGAAGTGSVFHGGRPLRLRVLSTRSMVQSREGEPLACVAGSVSRSSASSPEWQRRPKRVGLSGSSSGRRRRVGRPDGATCGPGGFVVRPGVPSSEHGELRGG